MALIEIMAQRDMLGKVTMEQEVFEVMGIPFLTDQFNLMNQGGKKLKDHQFD